MNRYIFIAGLLMCIYFTGFSQEMEASDRNSYDHRKNTVYFELLGNNGIYSLNYERKLHSWQDNIQTLALSAGFNIPFSLFETRLPLELKYFYGIKNCLELGTGLTLGTANWFDEFEQDKFVGSYFVLRAGYRYSNKGFLVRIAPMLHMPKYWSSSLWGGVSVGYSF